MKRNTLAISLITALSVLSISPISLAAQCKNVVFTIQNDHVEQRKIKVQSIEFRNPHKNGKVQRENVKNIECAFGTTCRTHGDNLANAAKVDLYDIRVVFRNFEGDGTWSKPFITKPFTPKFRKCTDDKKYGPIVVKDTL